MSAKDLQARPVRQQSAPEGVVLGGAGEGRASAITYSVPLRADSWDAEPGSGHINLRWRWLVRLVMWTFRKFGAKP